MHVTLIFGDFALFSQPIETLWTGAGLLISRDKWLVDFNAGKARLVLFDLSINTSAIDVKIDGSVLEEKSSCKMPGLTFSS